MPTASSSNLLPLTWCQRTRHRHRPRRKSFQWLQARIITGHRVTGVGMGAGFGLAAVGVSGAVMDGVAITVGDGMATGVGVASTEVEVCITEAGAVTTVAAVGSTEAEDMAVATGGRFQGAED